MVNNYKFSLFHVHFTELATDWSSPKFSMWEVPRPRLSVDGLKKGANVLTDGRWTDSTKHTMQTLKIIGILSTGIILPQHILSNAKCCKDQYRQDIQAVRTNRYRQILQGLQDEITDNASIVHVHSWAKCVEYSGNTYCHVFLQLQTACHTYAAQPLIFLIKQISHNVVNKQGRQQ